MAIIVLFRHLPTIDDINRVYTRNNSTIPFAQFSGNIINKIIEESNSFVRKFNVNYIYCSDNSRGIGTAKILFERMDRLKKIIPDERLNNILQPEWANKRIDDVKKTPLYKKWHSNPKAVKFLDGESLFDVENRIKSFLEDIDYNSAFLISHTTPMQVILCKLLGIDIGKNWIFKFDHLSFTVVKGDILLRYNSKNIIDIDLEELI
jgi:broad specificity phosphatase PhoE